MAKININDFFTASNELLTDKTPKAYQNKLKLEKGNEYLVRFVPYLIDVADAAESLRKTIFEFKQYAWPNIQSGGWVYALSPSTFGEPCPMTEFKYRKTNNEAIALRQEQLTRRQIAYYNVYIVQDPANPENNGTVKVLSASKQINDAIKDALKPENAKNMLEEYGIADMKKAMFDLSPDGINFCIRVTEQGDFPNYKTSSFVGRRRDLKLTKDDISTIHDSVHDLESFEKRYSVEEVTELFNTTFLGAEPGTTIDYAEQAPSKSVAKASKTTKTKAKDEEPAIVDIDELDDFLAAQSE